MASSSDSQTQWSPESNMQRLPATRKFSNEIPHSISQVMNSSEPTLVVLKTGDRASDHLIISPCGSKTVALFFISYFVHTSLKQPLSWSSSLMVRLLDDVDFRTVGRYLLHETSSRAQDPTGSMLTGIILQGYPKSILSKLHLQWWSDFERRLEAGEIEFQQFMMHDSFLLTLRPDSKIQERGIPRYSIKKADPTCISSCFEAIMSIAKIPFVDSLIKETLPADKERQPINLDQNRLFEHLAEFRKTQTIARNEAQQLIRAGQRPRTGDLRRTTGLTVVRQSQSSYELSLHPSESPETPRWVRQMQDDRHRSHSIPHAAGTSTRDRHISMSNETFFSTKSHDSKDTFVTASDGVRSSGSISNPRTGLGNKSNTDPFQCAHGPRTDGPFFTLLKSRGLWPPHPTREHNWSGRGQHVEFQRDERHIIKELLDTSSTLGCTNSAVVEIVKCKRIHLARKTIFCSKHFTKQQAIEEVAHLEKIQHSHIVRVIGTYTIANEISILLYPVAEYNLETFLQELRDHCVDAYEPGCLLAVKDFFGCLANAVDFIHSKRTKHMDIKPKNILVRKVHRKSDAHESPWKVYIADFGIARSYSSIAASETEGPTMFTRKYAAPEVVEQDRRGLQADIFSLGCVFTEIGATIAEIVPLENALLSSPVENLDARLASNENGDSSYHANIRTVQEFVQRSDIGNILRYYLQFRLRYAHDVIAQMLEPYPTNRPTARVVAAYFRGGSACCWDPPDPLEDNVPGMDEEFGHHLKDYDMTWDWCGERKRPPSPGDLSGEKKSAYRMSHLSLHSTSNLNY